MVGAILLPFFRGRSRNSRDTGICGLCEDDGVLHTMQNCLHLFYLPAICINISEVYQRGKKDTKSCSKVNLIKCLPTFMCFTSRELFPCLHRGSCHMYNVSLSHKTPLLVLPYTMHIAFDSFNKAYCSSKSLLYIPE